MTEDAYAAHKTLLALLPDGPLKQREHLAFLVAAAPHFPERVLAELRALPYFMPLYNPVLQVLRSVVPDALIDYLDKVGRDQTLPVYQEWVNHWSQKDRSLPPTVRLHVLRRGLTRPPSHPDVQADLEVLLTSATATLPHEQNDLLDLLFLTYLARRGKHHVLQTELWRRLIRQDDSGLPYRFPFRMVALQGTVAYRSVILHLRRMQAHATPTLWKPKLDAWLMGLRWQLLWDTQTRVLSRQGLLRQTYRLPRWVYHRQVRLYALQQNAPDKNVALSAFTQIDKAIVAWQRRSKTRVTAAEVDDWLTVLAVLPPGHEHRLDLETEIVVTVERHDRQRAIQLAEAWWNTPGHPRQRKLDTLRRPRKTAPEAPVA